jgi:hypothetical protein
MKPKLMLFAVVLVVLMLFPLAVSADLPPRPTPESAPTTGTAPPKLAGGWIELRAQGAPAGAWSVVQWQDSAGAWQNVESWSGGFDTVENGAGKKTWSVDQWIFGAGPFRWVVYDKRGGTTLATSALFTLPKENRQTVVVQVTLAP